ncbi:response regulator [Paucibacter sp. B2R-40]|uniref:response regulator n=1 Tax=Paucibacter sp. B2R-40 TaxID=2893554 RepID=UPI0021E4D78B|nr:response regulator [Paucibacter sp. B2R-40]MCV2356848.1 response regulator [Paucibacter sp. B2R-40]
MNASWYRNLSIRAKLLAGFGVVIVTLAALWWVADTGLRQLNTAARELGLDRYPKADQSNDMIKAALIASQSVRDVAFSDNEAENREDLNLIRKHRAELEALLIRFDNNNKNAEERNMIELIKLRKAKLDEKYLGYYKLLDQGKRGLGDYINNELAPADDAFVNALQVFEDYQATQVGEATKNGQELYASLQSYLLLAGAIGLGLSLLLSLTISRGISAALKSATANLETFVSGWDEKAQIAGAIAGGDLDREVTRSKPLEIDSAALSQDETGQLLSIVRMLSLGQQSFEDAISNMTSSLREKRSTERANDWLKTGESELNTLLRGEQSTAELAERSLAFLARYLKAGVGAFYVYERGSQDLLLAATYAFTRRKQIGERIRLGEGLVGQVARERQMICWTQVPADYLQIGSALGESAPANAVALPVLRDGALLGVIELGSFLTLSDAELDFLRGAADSLAISLGVADSRQRINELLEETRQQAERLQAQQEQLQQSNEELEERTALLERQRAEVNAKNLEIETASAEMQRKAEELSRISTYKSEFLANMSHELRTPLNSMMILSRLLHENKEGTLNERQQEFAHTIHSAGGDLLNLINDILDLSKIEAGQMQFHLEAVPLRPMCERVHTLFTAQAEQKGLQLELKVEPDVPATLRTDDQRVQQILKNLLSNALKFTAEGRVGLVVRRLPAQQSALGQDSLAFEVQDSGIGIPADKLQLVFEAFHQADGTTSRKYGGTGLGLSIARQLARHLGGDILLQSQLGAGSQFSLLLPLDGLQSQAHSVAQSFAHSAIQSATQSAPLSAPFEAAPAPKAKGQQAAAALPLPSQFTADDRHLLGQGQRSILIIEDDLHFARILLDTVRDKGFLGLVAGDASSGIALAHQFQPNAVILDILLPDMDGWAVMRRLKDDALTRHIPVHFLTCLEDRQRALSMGAVGLITKPVSAEQIQQVLGTLAGAMDKAVRQLLIVEDDEQELHALRHLFTDSEVDIHLARNSAEAVAALSQREFDCVVLDLGLPDSSGFAVLDTMQELPPLRRAPVIVHTGRELTRQERDHLDRYAQSVIIKGARSPERLLNEVTLFLHTVEGRLPPEKRRMIRQALDKEAMLTGRKVLIVDDDMRNIYSLASLLNEKEMQVLEAENGQEALQKLAQHPDIDLVLMDVMMPVMDGYTAMREIRANPALAGLPIIAMTAKALRGDQEKCLESGANDYIAKPLDVDKLFSLLRVWLYERRPLGSDRDTQK